MSWLVQTSFRDVGLNVFTDISGRKRKINRERFFYTKTLASKFLVTLKVSQIYLISGTL